MRLEKLSRRLQDLDPARLSAAVGFDGFVDEIVELWIVGSPLTPTPE